MTETREQLLQLGEFFKDGDVSQPTGTPPNLADFSCLDISSHSAFLSMLPSMLARLPSLETATSRVLSEADASLMTLPSHGIDSSFRAQTSDEMKSLSQARTSVIDLRNRAVALTDDLKASRRIWSLTAEIASDLDATRDETLGEIKRLQWRSRLPSNGVLLTPQSSPRSFPETRQPRTPTKALERLRTTTFRIQSDVSTPLSALSKRIPSPLATHLQQAAESAQEYSARVTTLVDLWRRVIAQTEAMTAISDEASRLGQAIDDTKQHVSNHEAHIVATNTSSILLDVEKEYGAIVAQHHQAIQSFIDNLASRVPIVRGTNSHSVTFEATLEAPSVDQLPRLHARQLTAVPPNLAVLDATVRSDSNALAMSLSGNLQLLNRAVDRLKVFMLARDASATLASWTGQITDAEVLLHSLRADLATATSSEDGRLAQLESLRTRLTSELDTQRNAIGRARSPVRQAVQLMQAAAAALGSMSLEEIIVRRGRQFEDAGRRVDALDEVRSRVWTVSGSQRNSCRVS